MISLKMTIEDIAMKAGLKGVERRLRQPQRAMKSMGLVLLRSISKTFKAGGRPARWPASARAKAGKGRTLIKTGRLLRSITMDVAGKTLTVGTNVKYARIHQLGGTIRPKTAKALKFYVAGIGWRTMQKVEIPKRPFLVVQNEDVRAFRRILGDYMAEG